MKYLKLILLGLCFFSCSELCDTDESTGEDTCAEEDTWANSNEDTSSAWNDPTEEELASYEDDEDDGWFVDVLVAIFSDDDEDDWEANSDRCVYYDGHSACNSKRDAKSLIGFDIGRNSTYQPKSITLYRGDFELGFEIAKLDDYDNVEINVPVGEVSAVAVYEVNGKIIKAVDGATLEYNVRDFCDRQCYDIKPIVFRLGLDERLLEDL